MSEKWFILFFDASMRTKSDRKAYVKFVKYLKSVGYTAMQKSVYVHYTDKSGGFDAEQKRMQKNTPDSVKVRLMLLPIKYFDSMLSINCERGDFPLRKNIFCC